MTTLIDENDLLVFDPKSAGIILSVGDGILTKSKKIVASLTNALILFSDKVVNQEISFIRFQNHRMVFIHEKKLFGVKLVPKDQLTKNFVPSIKIILNIENQLIDLDKKLQESVSNTIVTFYNLLRNPGETLYIFPDSIDGYLSLLTVMATLNYDLFVNLDSIKKNFLIAKSSENLNNSINPNIRGILNFGANLSEFNLQFDKSSIIPVNLNDSIFNTIFPNTKSIYHLISQIIGRESSSYIIAQIITQEQSINEIALSLIKIPEVSMSIDIAIEAITNFSKEQRLSKPLYRIIIKKLKDLEGKTDFELSIQNTLFTSTTSIQEIKDEKVQKETPDISTQSIKTVDLEPQKEIATEEKTSFQKKMDSSELTSLANEFTSKLENLTKNEPVNQNITFETKKEPSEVRKYDNDINKLKLDKNHMFMENFKVYFDFSPFRLGSKPEEILYYPSIQVVRINNENSQVNLKIDPERYNWFHDTLSNFKENVPIDFIGESGIFEVITSNENLPDVMRIVIWSCIIELTYAIQNGEIELPEIFKIPNKSNLCLILDLPIERRKQLPSQIREIIEEDKLIMGNGVEDLVNSIDKTLVTLTDALKTKKGVGFVLRKDSKELALILEFVLTLSELTGIGWSRW